MKKARLVTTYKRRLGVHARHQQMAQRARAATMIQRAWRRYVLEYEDGVAPDEASLLVKQLIRGHEKM